MQTLYNAQLIEKKWQKNWDVAGIFRAVEDCSVEKYYLLEMFPYPSGKIHMGHVRVYTIGDVIARYKRMCGFNVLHTMGWDAFGMPAENAAIAGGVHPAEWTYENIKRMRLQLKSLGFSYDWSREITTCNSEYYRWEQWLFIKMIEKGMAYRKESFVNWCEQCKTVLANEQVEVGMCWRCGKPVIQKKLWQWFFNITDYAEDLLFYCDHLSGWPEKVVSMQKHWIGKKNGVEVVFPIDSEHEISVFTTRPDTIFGVTFVSLAPTHPMVLKLARGTDYYDQVLIFIKNMGLENRTSKLIDEYEKKGVFTGGFCINPATGERIPVYVANFVFMEYGTGAIMSVPAHDQRDFEFANKYNLPIKIVIDVDGCSSSVSKLKKAFTGKGIMINSGYFNGLSSTEALKSITKYLEDKDVARKTVSFRLRDWGVSRQRYWGTPIPVVYCDVCGMVPVREQDLPVVLPEKFSDFKNDCSPLSKIDHFVITPCPTCGKEGARRETDTMDTFVESSWYFERFCSPDCNTGMFDRKAVNYWMPVDQYVGGIEHAILHLLYSRYFTRILNELGLVNYKEPFKRVLTQGMVCKETYKCSQDGFVFPDDALVNNTNASCKKCGSSVNIGRVEKMSKSKKNIVDPDDLIDRYGADTVRLFCLFAAPPEKDLEWSEDGVEGSLRFLNRVWRVVSDWSEVTASVVTESLIFDLLPDLFQQLLWKTHDTIYKVTQDIEGKFHFNTAISSIMELVNVMYTIKSFKVGSHEKSVMRFSLESVILLLYPIVPHFCEELWHRLGNFDLLAKQSWPSYDEKIILRSKIIMVIQINGKLRSRIEIERDMPENQLKEMIFSDKYILKLLEGKTVLRTILVKNKLINIVLS